MVDAFFAAMENGDEAAASALFTEDAEIVYPYNPNGDASDAAIRRVPARDYTRAASTKYSEIRLVERRYSPVTDGSTMWVEAKGKLRIAATGAAYENRYVFKFKLDGEKISRITEYTNVATVAKSGANSTIAR